MRHGRLDWPRPADLTHAARAVYDKIVGGPRASGTPAFRLTDDSGRLEGPFNAMLVNPRVGDAIQELGAAIRYGTALTDREREIAILTLAALRRSNFEWYAHERVGRAAGLDSVELDALAAGRVADSFSAGESRVRRVVELLVHEGDLNDAEFENAKSVLGLPKLADLVALIGYYDLLALSLRVWRTPLPADVRARFDGSTMPG